MNSLTSINHERRTKRNKTNKNTLFRSTGYTETVTINKKILNYMMQQLVKTDHIIINGKLYKVEEQTLMQHHI